jgi:hypothetical protein
VTSLRYVAVRPQRLRGRSRAPAGDAFSFAETLGRDPPPVPEVELPTGLKAAAPRRRTSQIAQYLGGGAAR